MWKRGGLAVIQQLQDLFGDLALAIDMAQGTHGRGASRQTINACLSQTAAIVNAEGRDENGGESQQGDAPEAE